MEDFTFVLSDLNQKEIGDMLWDLPTQAATLKDVSARGNWGDYSILVIYYKTPYVKIYVWRNFICDHHCNAPALACSSSQCHSHCHGPLCNLLWEQVVQSGQVLKFHLQGYEVLAQFLAPARPGWSRGSCSHPVKSWHLSHLWGACLSWHKMLLIQAKEQTKEGKRWRRLDLSCSTSMDPLKTTARRRWAAVTVSLLLYFGNGCDPSNTMLVVVWGRLCCSMASVDASYSMVLVGVGGGCAAAWL